MKASRVSLQRRKAVLWDAVEQCKSREQMPYAAVYAAAEAALATDAAMQHAEKEIAKDVKRTFPWMESYASREAATRNVLLAYSYRNPAVGYCQSLNFITGALLMAPLSEEDAFFSLITIIEDLMPTDYYTRDDDLLGARIDQLASQVAGVRKELHGESSRDGGKASCRSSSAGSDGDEAAR